jgi:hypothetical protein
VVTALVVEDEVVEEEEGEFQQAPFWQQSPQ